MVMSMIHARKYRESCECIIES